ncbi:PREDICTED: uncharacterized protein LOC107074483 [Polistes dominula]|uniref:Uncharacterized protein LOC107074483 n=1 Tax=Polistes dominula TaxID=743375 RepID=A0ABM1JG63_POLDO|nr:PREDICTED: uncharacterized protein LOC107074483 [Polistes dominula]
MSSNILSNLLRARKIYKTFISHNNRSITYSLLKQTRCYSDINPNTLSKEEPVNEDENNLAEKISSRYKLFQDKDSKVILDVDEERERMLLDDLRREEEHHDPYEGLNLTRGINGVYEIEDLIAVLQKDNARNIFVASVPKEYNYVDYFVVVTGKSKKHMTALAEYVRKIFKLKRHKTDIIPKIEGANSNEWIALDLGNIALHIFSSEARERFDLELLWSVGSQYDELTNTPQHVDIMDRYNTFLNTFQPENPEFSENPEIPNNP